MASKTLYLVSFSSICLMFSDGVINFQRFLHNSALEQTVCSSNDVLFNVFVNTDIACSLQCDQTSTCRSCMYNRDSKDCIGCSVKHTGNSSMEMAAGYQYFEKTAKNYNASCQDTSDCYGKNVACEEARLQCVCFPGYSYKASNQSCVAGCDVYGNTYEKYPKHKLYNLNTVIYTNSSFDHCANKCNNATFECKSFDLGTGGQCRLSTATAQTHPDAMVYVENSDYYNRNCA